MNKKLTAILAASLVAGLAHGAVLSYTTGLEAWYDSRDINGNGDSNAGWNNDDGFSTSQTWVNKGTAGNPNACGVGNLAVNPVYQKFHSDFQRTDNTGRGVQ